MSSLRLEEKSAAAIIKANLVISKEKVGLLMIYDIYC